jgi:hypothetical protein
MAQTSSGSRALARRAVEWVLIALAVGLGTYISMSGSPHGPAPSAARPSPSSRPPAQGPKIADFRLDDDDGRSVELYRQGDATAVVVIAQGNGCPIMERSVPYLEALRDEFTPKGVRFYLLNPTADTRDEVRKEAEKFRFGIPVLLDPTQEVARDIGFTRLSEAALIDTREWKMVYRGAIDDRFDYNGDRTQAAQTPLRDAIEALLGGRPVAVERTQAKGCIIDFRARQKVSYSRQIVPLLDDKCLSCHHQPYGTPPHFLESYEKLRGWLPMIKETVITERMPPWWAESRYHFSNDISMSLEEKRMLLDWIAQGGSRDDGGPDPLVALSKRPHPLPRGYDMVLEAHHPIQVPASGLVPYQYVEVGQRFDKDTWVNSFIIRPSNRRVAHHGQLLVLPRPLASYGNGAKVRRNMMNDDRIERIGFWNPGKKAGWVVPPPGAYFIPRGSYLALEMHYEPIGSAEVDRPSVYVNLYRGQQKPRPMHSVFVQNMAFEIPPGVRDYEVKATQRFDRSIAVVQVGAHMHTRAVGFRLEVRKPDGQTDTILSLPYYDWRSQQGYNLTTPLHLPAGSVITATGIFDNSKQNPTNPDPTRAVHFGLHTYQDEMFRAKIAFWYED